MHLLKRKTTVMPDAAESPPRAESPTRTSFSIICNDGLTIPISLEAMKHSIILRTMVEDIDMESGEMAIPLDHVDGPTGAMIVEWCEQHKADPLPEIEGPDPNPTPAAPPYDMPSWDREFLGKEHCPIPLMSKLVTAANFLEIPWLYKFCCKRIFLDYIKDSTVDELRALLEPREDPFTF
ncbi:hypothetical protein QR680_000321 [Steinernema hermaphroditum]|uniref:Skp1-related protein n=2 Tax=Steinernema hermaphroditum TaxID=289476 RepID=A0AA39GU60_9BILA|nr:hypothetical protein QR680_000321 [Steinernema hermaphroditum]